MPDYQKSKIYKLWSPSKNIVYIGSTTETLAQRLAKHIANHKAYNKGTSKLCYTSYLILECEDYKIELLEEYACNNKQQLLRKEGEYIRANICVNKIIAGRTDKEYCIDNIDKKKQYDIDNADKIKEDNKKWRDNNADKLKEYIKQYRIDNAEKIKERKRQYYLNKKLEKKI